MKTIQTATEVKYSTDTARELADAVHLQRLQIEKLQNEITLISLQANLKDSKKTHGITE